MQKAMETLFVVRHLPRLWLQKAKTRRCCQRLIIWRRHATIVMNRYLALIVHGNAPEWDSELIFGMGNASAEVLAICRSTAGSTLGGTHRLGTFQGTLSSNPRKTCGWRYCWDSLIITFVTFTSPEPLLWLTWLRFQSRRNVKSYFFALTDACHSHCLCY